MTITRMVFVAVAAVIAAAVGMALLHSFIPWLLVGLVALVGLRYGLRRYRRL
jgi:hypothetical protein